MNIIKQNALLAFLLTFIAVVSCVTDVKAGALSQNPLLQESPIQSPFKWNTVPVICGTTEAVNIYVTLNDFVLQSFSFGKENGDPEGDVAFLVSYFIKKDGSEAMSIITSPSGDESCIMYRSFNHQLVLPGEAT